MRKFLLLLLSFPLLSNAQNKIKYFFNQPVNTSVAKGVNAQYLHNCMGDTIVAYINRSKYTLDIAVYNYTSSFPAIATAINSAYARGVKVRWIYDYSSSNTGIPLLNSAINKLQSPPNTGSYNIMHNKFMIIDANSANPGDAYVWTGSSNWNTQQFNYDYNNCLVIQDQALAKAYRNHFNMMWGDTGIAPNNTLSKFGSFKTDLGAHTFVVEGKTIELYFSPSDGVNNKILNAINTANTDMYFGMSTFTYNTDASQLVAKYGAGVYVAGIDDGSVSSSSTNSILSSGLGSKFIVYSGSDLYHNKFLIVDPSNTCSDPLVLTGSHNWTVSADTKNDENTLIIHDDTAANIYYQSFYANFQTLGGTLSAVTGCPTGIDEVTAAANDIMLMPNPSAGDFTVVFEKDISTTTSIAVYDLQGRLILQPLTAGNSAANATQIHFALSVPGTYMVRVSTEYGSSSKLITVLP